MRLRKNLREMVRGPEASVPYAVRGSWDIRAVLFLWAI